MAARKPKTLAEVFSEEASKPGTMAWFDMVRERYGDLLKMDGYDDCIIGLAHQFNKTVILYDKEKVIIKLTKELWPRDEKDRLMHGDEAHEQAETSAQEWFDFNMIGAWLGDATPSFFTAE